MSGRADIQTARQGLAEPDGSGRAWRALAALLVYVLVVWVLPRPEAINPPSWRLVGIFLATIAGLILQPIPGGAVVLLAVGLSAVLGGLKVTEALAGYGDPTVWLVMAAFFISRALIKTGLARRIALFFVRLFGTSSLGVCYALALSDMTLASIIPSNAARSGGVILPIARSIAEVYGSRPGPTSALLGSFLMTGVYQSICVTAAMFFTGQASNPLAARLATEQFHYPITWTSWFLAGIVPGICSLAFIPWVIMRLNPPGIRRTPEASAFARKELEAMGPMRLEEKMVAAVFAAVCGLWMTSSWHKIDVAISGLLGSVALLIAGVLSWEDVKSEKAAWDIFVWYGGLLCLGRQLAELGVTAEFARGVSALLGHTGWTTLFGVALLVYFYSHYAFASITSHVLAMYAPFLAVLVARGAPTGLPAYAFACFVCLAAGLTNYGTTPSPMFFAQGYVSFRMWWTVGAVVSALNFVIWATIGFGWWKLIGVW
jgi:DASS family divalent anion:Na+ symporter